MTQAIAVRRDGDSFQARIFWRKATGLLDPRGAILKVGFESGPKGFDDVWVAYDPGRAPSDQEGQPILREHIQCKWHVLVNDLGYADLIDPEWINANKVSLLQRARLAQMKHAPAGIGARFKLLTNWRVAQTDPLRRYINQRSKTLRLKDLFDGSTDASMPGKVRKLWRDHLGIDEKELQTLARTLALDTDSSSLEDHRENLDILFENRGLRRIPPNESSFLYDDLTYQWLAQGRLEFDRESFRQICKKEGLLSNEGRVHFIYGVKSFEHPFDRLEDRCVATLDLVPYFDERAIHDQAEWSKSIYPSLRSFLMRVAKEHQQLKLVLDAHVTLAFAAGSVLNIKSGRMIEIEQRTLQSNIWHANDMPADPGWPGWDFSVEQLCQAPGEIAVAVSLTHDVSSAVKSYLQKNVPSVSTLLLARPVGGSSARSVACGQHAFNLAESLVQRVNEECVSNKSLLHLFIAGPNAFTFFLGQRQAGLGPTALYEYDLEGGDNRSYTKSLSLPIP